MNNKRIKGKTTDITIRRSSSSSRLVLDLEKQNTPIIHRDTAENLLGIERSAQRTRIELPKDTDPRMAREHAFVVLQAVDVAPQQPNQVTHSFPGASALVESWLAPTKPPTALEKLLLLK
jgi:hypothetical protein